MRPWIFWLMLLCAVSATSMGQNIDTRHLALHLRFDWQKRQAIGKAEIAARLLNEGDRLYLDAGYLAIQSVTLNGRQLAFTYNGGDQDNSLEIILDRNYLPTESFTLVINYHTTHENNSDPLTLGGSFGKGLRFQNTTAVTPKKRKQVWSSGEPQNNKYWFPCNEDIADIHTTELFLTVEPPLMAIGNGKLVDISENPDQSRTFHYWADQPFPNYLVSVVVGEYADVSQMAGDKIIHNFGYADERKAVEATVVLLPEMLTFLEEKTCTPYPYKSYSQVVVQDYPFPGGVGQHTATILSDNYIDDYGVHKDFQYLWDGVAVQALANQWFGNLLMPATWGDVWLNNGFAQYFAGLFTEKNHTRDEYLTYYYPFEKSNVIADWDSGNRHPIRDTMIGDLSAFVVDGYSKYRAALVLRMLQKELGDENWWKAVCDFVQTNAHRQVAAKDFQNSVEKISGKSFQWFFDQWFNKIGLAKLKVDKHYDEKQNQLILNVSQIQNQEDNMSYPMVSYFEGTIAIEIDGRLMNVYLQPQRENQYFFACPAYPKFVNFNNEENFLCEVEFEQSVEEYFYQLEFSKDVLARQKAMDRLVTMCNDSTASQAVKDRLWLALTREVSSDRYWRYRWYALGSLQKIIPPPYDERTLAFLETTIQKESSWIKSTAIQMLGRSKQSRFKDIYLSALHDPSDRVINAAAIALGKTKCKEAYEELIKLESRPSWKNQNRISALNGLQQLGDQRAVDYMLSCIKDNTSPRWYLATPVWDYPYAAVNALVALGMADLAYNSLWARLHEAIRDGDINDVFQQVQLINLLKDKRAAEVYGLLKETYKADPVILEAVLQYEGLFLEAMKH
jgi:aminopeptidase N